jgi:N-acetylmuramoyl-L-alanine amidase
VRRPAFLAAFALLLAFALLAFPAARALAAGEGAKAAGTKADVPGKGGGKAAPASGAGDGKSARSKANVPRKVLVNDIQVYSGHDYSRIVLVLSGEAKHRWQLLPPDPSDGGVRRLYVDLDAAEIRKGLKGRFDVGGDVARKVRLSYFKPDVVRLVVEVENLKSQGVFVLENPFRVIVDVAGEASRAASPTKAPAAGQDKGLALPQPPVAAGALKPGAQERQNGRKEGGARAPAAAPQAPAPLGGPDAPLAARAASAKAAREDKPGSPGVNLATPGRKKMARQLVEQLGLTVRTVMIDAGHGGRDSGARGPGGLYEKTVTLEVAKLLGKRLEQMGFEALYTRTTDKYVPLEVRTAMANARKADLFISVHCNAHGDPGSSGMETYSLNLASTADEVRVAARENAVAPRRISDMQKILDELMHASKLTESREFARTAHQATLAQARKTLNLRDRGVHEAPFYVLLGAKMPSILVEIGYITNPAEAAKLKDSKYLDSLAKGIAEGVAAYKTRIERFASGQ